MSKLEFWTPGGKTSHWKAILKYEIKRGMNIKMAYKLSEAPIDPKGFQKMNVPLAYQLFDKSVASAIETFRGEPEKYSDLADAEPTIKFINRMNSLIKAMSSNPSYQKFSFFVEKRNFFLSYVHEKWYIRVF